MLVHRSASGGVLPRGLRVRGALALLHALAIALLGAPAPATEPPTATETEPAPAPAPAPAPVPAPVPAPPEPPTPAPPEPIPAGAAAEEQASHPPQSPLPEQPLPEPASPEPRPIPPYFPVNFSVFYPLGMNAAAPDLWTNFDLSLILGRVGFVDGSQIGLLTWTGYDLRGLQLGIGSVVSGNTQGVQVAGAFAFTDGAFEGIQVSGIFGWASASLLGLQVSGIANQTYGDLTGVQSALAINIARQQLSGIQTAAINIGRVDGLQVGAINVSQEQRGLQIGILNIARKIDGLQIGVINVTDNLEGESLGIIPLPRQGGIHLAAWGATSLYGNFGVKFSSRYAYTILSAAFHSEAPEEGGTSREPVYAGGLTMGARLPFGYEGLSVSADLGAYRRFRNELSFSGRDELFKLRVVAAYALAPRLSPFVCGGVWASVRDDFGFGPELCVGLEL